MKETELAAVIEGEIQAYGVGYDGARRARGFAFVMSGPENTAGAWAAYNISTDRKIANGDLILIELDSQVDGYWSDLSRTWVAGEPSAKQREIWSAVHESQQRTVEAVRTGCKISQVDGIARDFLAARGYGREFLHHIGHGVGFSFHEAPYLDPPSRVSTDWEIRPRMVFAIEPGVYIEGWGGVRIEDNVVVNEAGRAEFLSTADRGL
jgi:Xaa-Pro aminopeptidase